MYRVTVVLFAIIGTSFAQVLDGGCPPVRVVQGFNTSSYSGTWNEWARFTTLTGLETRCGYANYTFFNNGSATIVSTAIYPDNVRRTVDGSVFLAEPIGQLNISFPQLGTGTYDYSILDTDYDNWSAVFRCQDFGNNTHQVYIWFMMRSTYPTAAAVIEAGNAFVRQGISLLPLKPVDQQSCADSTQ